MNRHALRIYLVLLASVVAGWMVLRQKDVLQAIGEVTLLSTLSVCGLYLCSHIFRMLRLALLTLDDRHQALPLVFAHALTAFPSSLLPFKVGEALRLASFYHIYDYRQKALAVWLVERFGDLVVLAVLIAGLAIAQQDVSDIPQGLLSLVVLGLSLGLLCLLSLSKILHYLSRHLVLTGQKRRDLGLLRVSEVLFSMELDIRSSITGRWAGFLLLSAFIWTMEILAFAQFLKIVDHENKNLGAMFSDVFFTGLSFSGNGFTHLFEIHRSGALIMGTLVMTAVLLVSAKGRLRISA